MGGGWMAGGGGFSDIGKYLIIYVVTDYPILALYK